MTNINGKWIRQVHFDTEEDRKKAMSDWRRRYWETFRSDDQFCNWLKLKGFFSSKPVTPEYVKEQERQEALIEEFYKYQGVYDGLPEAHRFNGNGGKYWDIFRAEQRRMDARDRAESDKLLRKIRGNNVTQGHTPKRRKQPRPKTNYRG